MPTQCTDKFDAHDIFALDCLYFLIRIGTIIEIDRIMSSFDLISRRVLEVNIRHEIEKVPDKTIVNWVKFF